LTRHLPRFFGAPELRYLSTALRYLQKDTFWLTPGLGSGFSSLMEVCMSPLTVFLARFMGVFTILVVISFLVRGSTIIVATLADGPVMLVYAIISLAIGIAMIVGHNVWSGGALAVAVTIVGWLILAKGLLLLFLKPDALSGLVERMRYGDNYYLLLLPAFVIGLYLTWAGFTTAKSRDS
jgi:hypothetical protein